MASVSGTGLCWSSGVSSPLCSKPSALLRRRQSTVVRSAVSVERKRLNLQKSEEIFNAAKGTSKEEIAGAKLIRAKLSLSMSGRKRQHKYLKNYQQAGPKVGSGPAKGKS